MASAVKPRRQPRFHPLAALSAGSFIVAIALPFIGLGLRFTTSALVACVLLASPFVVLMLGHFYLCRSLRRNIALVLANVPLWCAWLFVATAMWYFQAGWYGVAVFSPLMAVLAGLCLLLALLIPEPDDAALR